MNSPSEQHHRLPEVPEAKADAATAGIYAEIKRLCGVPMVALLYRHFAAIPGALEWTWALIGPALERGLLQTRAWRLAEAAAIPAVSPIPRPALEVAGVSREAQAAIADVLAAFNRANPVNLMVARVLARCLREDVDSGRSLPQDPWSPPALLPSLPPMIEPEDLAPPQRALMGLLASRGGTDTSGIWPSMYRHLAHWPGYLAMASVILLPKLPDIDAAAARLHADADAAAAEIAAMLTPPGPVDGFGESARERLESAVERFSPRIPEMIVIGHLLARALPRSDKNYA